MTITKDTYLKLYMPVLADLDLDGGYTAAMRLAAYDATVCPQCRVDDFQHIQHCPMSREAYETWEREYGPSAVQQAKDQQRLACIHEARDAAEAQSLLERVIKLLKRFNDEELAILLSTGGITPQPGRWRMLEQLAAQLTR